MKEIKLKIKQGCVDVNNAHIEIDHKDIKLVYVDFKTKYADFIGNISGNGECPAIWIGAKGETINLNKSYTRKDDTRIEFLDLKDWYVSHGEVGRYTGRFTLLPIK
jgi:hypothetical protein